MYKVCLLYDIPGWSYQRRTDALARYAPDDFEVSTAARRDLHRVSRRPYDLILQLNYGMVAALRNMMIARRSRAVLVAGYNGGWGYRPELLPTLQRHADHVIFNNWENWDRWKRPANTSCIMNGVDRDVFSVFVPTVYRAPRVLWTGSAYHDRNKDLKGYRGILTPLKKRLHDSGFTTDFRLVESSGGAGRWSPEIMAKWYNSGMVYINASRVEGAVNPPLEAAACGCVVVSTPVGNMEQLIAPGSNGYLIERTVDAAIEAIVKVRERYEPMARQMQSDIAAWDWEGRAADYYELFRNLIKEARS